MIEFKCSQCGEVMEAPESLAGQTEKCPKCGSRNRAPEQAVPAALANRGKLLLILLVTAGLIGGAGVAVYLGVRQGRPTEAAHDAERHERPIPAVTKPLPAEAMAPQPSPVVVSKVETKRTDPDPPSKPDVPAIPVAAPVDPVPAVRPPAPLAGLGSAPVVASATNRLQLAEAFYDHDLLPKAKEILIEIIYTPAETNDAKSEALYLLGQVAFDEGHFKTAMDDWSKLQTDFPKSPRSKEVAAQTARLREVVAKFSDAKLSSVVARSYIKNGDFWSGADKVFTIDDSWLPHVEMAVDWYDKVLEEFPKSEAAEMAYARKLFALIDWWKVGRHVDADGIKRDFAEYMSQVLRTFAAFEADFPASPYLQGFRFQIAQAYWRKEDSPNAKVWLDKIIVAGGQADSFYTKLATARLHKLEHEH